MNEFIDLNENQMTIDLEMVDFKICISNTMIRQIFAFELQIFTPIIILLY